MDKKGAYKSFRVGGEEGEKKYDGSYTYTIDVSKIELNAYVEIQKWWGGEYITFNYLTLEFDKFYTLFDLKSYNANLLSRYININKIIWICYFILF